MSTRTQILSFFAVLFLGLASTSELLHYVLVPHSLCAAHGDIGHFEEARQTNGESGVGNIESGAHHSHEHCALYVNRRAWQAPQLGSAAVSLSNSAAIVPLKEARHPRKSIEIISLSPSLSPPTA